MDFIGIFFLVILGYRNSVRAKLKGQNGLLWGLLTVISYILCQAFGLFIVIALFCRDAVDMNMLAHRSGNFDAVSKQFNQQVAKALSDNPLREITVFLAGIGGYLLIRYILDRKPDKKQPQIPQTDNVSEG